MRKKTHIAVADFLSKELKLDELTKYRKSFYLGSILPDLTPSIVTEPHQFQITFGGLKEKMHELVQNNEREEQQRSLWRSLGVIIHYIADYFTFPHNDSYTGNLKDHCLYEGALKNQMRNCVAAGDAYKILEQQRKEMKDSMTLRELFELIEDYHQKYMALGSSHTPKDDCRWIVTVCSIVFLYFINWIKNELLFPVFELTHTA